MRANDGGGRVVVFEDDAELQDLLRIVLRTEGFEVHIERTGGSARAVADSFGPDLAIIDVRLEDDVSGFEAAQDLRHVDADLPIVFVTGADSLAERLTGFEAGADDYVVKPFAIPELVARVRALLRRAGRGGDGHVSRFADVEVDAATHTVWRAGSQVPLTAKEFDLLCAFLRRPRVVIGKRDLFGEVWGYPDSAPNVVEVHISSLRRKLEAHGPRLIHTVRSVGYILRTPAAIGAEA